MSDRAEFHEIALLLPEHRGALEAMPDDAAEAIRSQARRKVMAGAVHKPGSAALICSFDAVDVPSLRAHGGRRLIWAVDYHLLCRQFTATDWERLVAYCTAQDTGAAVHHALTGAIGDIGLALPDGIANRLLPASGRSPAFDYIRYGDTLSDIRADLGAAESLMVGARVLWRAAFAPRAQLLEKYPEALRWPTAALRVKRIGDGLMRVLRSRGTRSHP